MAGITTASNNCWQNNCHLEGIAPCVNLCEILFTQQAAPAFIQLEVYGINSVWTASIDEHIHTRTHVPFVFPDSL